MKAATAQRAIAPQHSTFWSSSPTRGRHRLVAPRVPWCLPVGDVWLEQHGELNCALARCHSCAIGANR